MTEEDKAGAPARFYTNVNVTETDEGFGVALDGRLARTPKGVRLLAAGRALAAAAAEEWRAQGDRIDFATMPITRLLAASVDHGPAGAPAWREKIIAYLGSDLVCYRAERPASLAARQAAAYDPILDWIAGEVGVRLLVAPGVMPVRQPAVAAPAGDRYLSKAPPAALLALSRLTELSGSAVLAMAVWKGRLEPDEAFDLSRLEEDFQAAQWGEDAEAAARARAGRAAFLDAAR